MVVLGVVENQITVFDITRQISDVNPRSRIPIRIIIALFGAF
jgi:hypothetical protein